jgi:uncharacterized protein
MITLIPVFVGLIMGVLSGLLGVGGGIVLIPILVLGFGISQHLAQGISLAVIIPTAITGLINFHRKGLIDYRMAGFLALGSIIGTSLSANYVHLIPGVTLTKVFGAIIAVIGMRMILTPAKLAEKKEQEKERNSNHEQK